MWRWCGLVVVWVGGGGSDGGRRGAVRVSACKRTWATAAIFIYFCCCCLSNCFFFGRGGLLAISVYGIKQRRRKALDCSMASLAWLPHTRTLHARTHPHLHTPARTPTRTDACRPARQHGCHERLLESSSSIPRLFNLGRIPGIEPIGGIPVQDPNYFAES